MKKSILTLFSFAISPLLASVQIDGNLNDWNDLQRLNMPQDLPSSLADKTAVYGTYSNTENKYKFAVSLDNGTIGSNTTIWLNTDNDTSTGHKIWGQYSGMEYYINIHTDNQPYLYKTEPFGEYVTGPLEYSYNSNQSAIEIALDSSLIDNVQSDITILTDINDSIFIPSSYISGDLQITANDITLPPRTDFTKKVGIVFSDSSRNNFYDVGLSVQKAYNQLFMTMQNQTMMAGIPFDLLTENDLTDVENIKNYDTLIMPYFGYAPKANFSKIKNTLFHAVNSYGIGIITAGDFMSGYGDGSAVEGDSYRHMKQLLGVSLANGDGPVNLTLNATNNTHPATNDYKKDEVIFKYNAPLWYSTYNPVSNSKGETLPYTNIAYQKVEGISNKLNAVLAIDNGGRHVHFSSLEFLGNTNLLWSAIQWSVYGNEKPVSLQMGRFNNLFVSRNDMDQSQEIYEVEEVNGELLNLLISWKSKYDFVGSYFINIGNNPPYQRTDWEYSRPLYRNYIDLGNEIGTHSYTHPHDTNKLTPAEIEFEFNQAMNEIAAQLNPTWREVEARGAAVPGAPEGVETAKEIISHLDYMSGGYSGVGAGYPGAMGYLTPDSKKVYFSPNMSFDFTMLEFGVPVYDNATGTWYPQPLNAVQAEAKWEEEYNTLMKHSKLPIIHWAWHDYGPTTALNKPNPYTISMFENTIKLAHNDNSEFITSIDAAQRIATFKDAKFNVTHIDNDTIKVKVNSNNVGKFAIDMQTLTGQKIKNVENWYAYNDKKVFLDNNGGEFTINLSNSSDSVTKINELPMRAELISVDGDSNNLKFVFKGQGKVKLKLKNYYWRYSYTGFSSGRATNYKDVELYFNDYGTHTVQIRSRY